MSWEQRWSAHIERRRARRWRVRLTWQTCHKCGNYSFLPDALSVELAPAEITELDILRPAGGRVANEGETNRTTAAR